MKRRLTGRSIFAALAGVLLAGSLTARAAQGKAGQVTKDEFFLISSLNMQKHELVLKLPTEVTMQMSITDKTPIVDEHGKPLRMADLRSGDTVYITYRQNGAGAEALSIRLGPMTIEELHRRYLKGDAMPAPVRPAPAPGVSATGARTRPAKVQRNRAKP
ncbi:MAG TPA: hypothetical protein VNJ12_13135 [Candidatus Dormibacteraeota bacterium]|nr:hypothetical protein [Candidatus Dormibacteraeota bacterium]